MNVGISGLEVKGTQGVHLLGAEFTKDPNLEIKVRAARFEQRRPGQYFSIGALRDDLLLTNDPLLDLEDVTAVDLAPSKTSAWYLVASITATRPGDFTTKALKVRYESDGSSETTTFEIHVHMPAYAPGTAVDLDHPIDIVERCPAAQSPPPNSFAEFASRARQLGGGTAVVRIDAVGSATWNTATGERPTAKDLDAGLRPMIHKPYRLHLLKPLSLNSDTGADLTAVNFGGTVGRDRISSCELAYPVDKGGTFVAVLGSPVASPAIGTRVFGLFALYPSHADDVETPFGLQSLSKLGAG